MKTTTLVVLAAAALLAGLAPGSAALDPPTCTNGDCSGPPVCTNGDCGPPSCTNGDCGDLVNCCCVGPNTVGTMRVCCCPSPNLDGMTCRASVVLDTGFPDNWHQTVAQEVLEGTRPRGCEVLTTKLCDPPVEQVCAKPKGKKTCKVVVRGICRKVDQICQYRYCGPSWFPFDEPAPELAGCEWWHDIRDCP
jgi:hypothetical protein